MVSPFYHYSSANLDADPNDFPVSTTEHWVWRYMGGEATLNVTLRKNEAQIGYYGFRQYDHNLVQLLFNDPSDPSFGSNFADPSSATGSLQAVFIQDKLKLAPWLTVIGGVRQTHFSGAVVENATSPRVGVAGPDPPPNLGLCRFFYTSLYRPPLVYSFSI